MRALVTSGGDPAVVLADDVPEPVPGPSQALVRLTATSLNRGEVRSARHAPAGEVWGWDVAGVVDRAAADGSGPTAGTRVVGLVRRGAWGERVAVETTQLATIPDAVTDAQAATLPVAALTALKALDRLGHLQGRRILVTGASGGVGRFAVQLAAMGGAEVVALARRTHGLRELGATDVVSDLAELDVPVDGVLESVGGDVLAAAVDHLAPFGVCVQFGASAEAPATIHPRALYASSGRIEGLLIFTELERSGQGTRDFERVLALVADGRLSCAIAWEGTWDRAAEASERLWDRRVDGKAVLHVA